MRPSDFSAAHQVVLIQLGVPPTKKIIILNGYPALHSTSDGSKRLLYVHRLVAERIKGVALTRSLFVHHIDGDRMNFLPDNLSVMTHGEHNGEHRRFGADNHFFGQKHTTEARRLIGDKHRGRPGTPVSDSARAAIREKTITRWQTDPAYAKLISDRVRETWPARRRRAKGLTP